MRYYEENVGSEESMRNAKMPIVKEMRQPDDSYMGKDIGGSEGYNSRKDKIFASDAKKLKSHKAK